MMCHMPIRRLTAAEKATRDEAEGEHYEALYAEIEAAERAEYDENYGPIYRQQHPFKPDGARIHAEVLARIRAEEN